MRAIRYGLAAALVAATAGGAWWYRSARPDDRWRRGQDALRAEDWSGVEDAARRLEDAGDADRACLLRGEALYRRGRYADAVAELNAVRDEGDLRVRAAVVQGLCFVRLRRLPEAYRVLTFAIDQRPDDPDAHRGLAAVHYDLGHLTQALRHLEQVARLDERDGRPHRQIGLIGKDLGKPDEAAAAYREALRRDLSPKARQEVRLELAEVLVRQLDHQGALRVLDDPEAARPENALALGLRGECLWALTRADEARTLLDQALKRHPSAGPLLRLRGQIHLADREPEQAAALLERAVARDAQDHASRYQLALAYDQLGRPADAAAQQERVKEIRGRLEMMTRLTKEAMDKPWDGGVRRRLAEVCADAGLFDLANLWRAATEACSP